MSRSVPVPSMPCLTPEQINGLLVHVDAEEVSLRNILRLLEELPRLSADPERRRDVQVRVEQSLQHTVFLRHHRVRVLTFLGRQLGMPPEDISFTSILPFATPAAQSLLVPARHRLQSLLRQVQALINSTAWIVQESRRIHLTILESLPGTVSSSRYDSSGQRHLNPAALRFETRS